MPFFACLMFPLFFVISGLAFFILHSFISYYRLIFFIYFILSTRYIVRAPLFLFPRVAFSRGTNVHSWITGAEFAIPWALPILFTVLVFQDAFS